MGQNLYDPPDVAGWDPGKAWFSTGAMLARMNFASTLASNQRFNLATAAAPHATTPETLLSYVLDPCDGAARQRREVGAGELSARDRPLDRQRGAAAGEGPGPRSSRGRAPRSISSYEGHQTRSSSRAASRRSPSPSPRPSSCRDLARAQGARARNLVVLYLGGGNDALSTLIPYNDPVLLQPPADAGGAGRQRAAGRHRSIERGARASSAADGPQADFRSRTSRAHSAHRLSEPEPLALSGHRHLVDGESGELRRASAGSAAISTRCRRRSIR